MDTKTVTRDDVSRQIALPVSLAETKVSISGGGFRILKQQYVLPEEFVYTFTPVDHKLTVYFYLMKKKADNSAVVLVDEIHPGELPLNMTTDPEYDYLWQLASLYVPPGAQNLKDAKLVVLHSDTETQPKKRK